MRIIVTMPVRNEDWIVGLTARAVLAWADEIIFLDHASTDNSRRIELEIAAEFPGRVTILIDDDPTWYECIHRQRLLEAARERAATHIALVDADEILTGNLIGNIRGLIEQMPADSVLQLPWVCLARGIDRYYADGVWFNNWVSCAFKDSPQAHWKARDGYDFHHRHPMGRPANFHRPVMQFAGDGHQGGLMHLQFVSERRLKAKQYLYQLTERQRWPSREPAHVVRERYSLAVYQSDPQQIATGRVQSAWWEPYGALMQHLRMEGEPWQEAACRKMLAASPNLAIGLDSFGVA